MGLGLTQIHHLFINRYVQKARDFLAFFLLTSQTLFGQQSASNPQDNPGIELTRQVLAQRVLEIEKANNLKQFTTKEDWARQREILRSQLVEMLGRQPVL
ncbi:MAG: hypothetical protein ACKO6B_12870 [Planctomycetia bacterium]